MDLGAGAVGRQVGDHLWALDSSLPNVDQQRLPPKLVEFDLSTNKVIRQYDFKGVVSPRIL